MTPVASDASRHEVQREVEDAGRPVRALITEIERTIVGQTPLIERLIIGLLCGGHILLEGVPGLAKTLTVSTLARGIRGEFKRIQFTPDLLPADLVGTLIYRPLDGTFTPRKGPVFANIVLADEINRAPAKVQSALLEAMQERQVTIGETTFRLPEPFLVLATQNPIEQEGTYPLPEAQVDRFLMKVRVEYPSAAEEREIVERMGTSRPATEVRPVMTLGQVESARLCVDRVHVDGAIKDYAVRLVRSTRNPADEVPVLGSGFARLVELGASPRASIALVLAAKANAFIRGRGFVTPSDIKQVAPDVLRHRVLASYEAQAEELDSDHIVRQILDHVAAP